MVQDTVGRVCPFDQQLLPTNRRHLRNVINVDAAVVRNKLRRSFTLQLQSIAVVTNNHYYYVIHFNHHICSCAFSCALHAFLIVIVLYSVDVVQQFNPWKCHFRRLSVRFTAHCESELKVYENGISTRLKMLPSPTKYHMLRTYSYLKSRICRLIYSNP